MVGDEGGAGGSAARLTAGLRAAYDAAADGWADGPEQLYAVLARALLRSAAVPLAGRQVLDLGAGTGVAGRAALAAGAHRVVAADLAAGMLRRCGAALHPVAADAAALPFRDGSFDLVVAAFCLNHLGNLAAGLGEARRVGRALAASTFAPGWTHPAKAAVDQALRPLGYRPPAWYAIGQARNRAPRRATRRRLGERAAAAGFTRVRVRTTAVPTGLSTPAQLASWRLGMAHRGPVPALAGCTAARAEPRRAAERAVAGTGPLVVSMVVLTAS